MKNKTILSAKQIEKISEVAEKPLESLLPALLFELGLRAYEVENLDLSDLTEKEDHWEVSVDYRDGERTLILVESIPELEEWLEYRQTEEDSLLVKSNGERLPVQKIYCILKKLGAKAKESDPNLFGNNSDPENLTIHDLIVSSAKHKVESRDISISQLQYWFGWTSEKTPRNFVDEFGGSTN